MARPLSIILADAFDSAARAVAEAPQAHEHYDLAAPTTWDNWVYWWRGFAAGLAGDFESMPVIARLVGPLRRSSSSPTYLDSEYNRK